MMLRVCQLLWLSVKDSLPSDMLVDFIEVGWMREKLSELEIVGLK
jgi:hypothetical protein